MRYSEAIRLGSMLYPQCRFRLSDGVGVCANGAAAIALGIPIATLVVQDKAVTPAAISEMLNREQILTLDAIVYKNDAADWTRERIADWLAASGHDFEIDLSEPECAPAAEPVAAGVAE